MKIGKFLISIALLVAVAACRAAPAPAPVSTPSATVPPAVTVSESTATATPQPVASALPASATPLPVPTVGAGEVVKLSGTSWTTSDPFRLSADTTLEISWIYTGSVPFALWLINVSDVVTDPQFDRILVNDISGPHAGTVTEPIIAGDWTIQVEQADGPWSISIKQSP